MKRPLIVAILIACAAVPAAAQNKGKRGFVWDDRPTIVFGEDVNIAVTGRALIEWRWFDPDIGEDLFALRAGRLGLKGDLTKHLDWEIEREIGAGNLEEDDSRIEFGEWKDVFVRWRTFDAARVKAGR